MDSEEIIDFRINKLFEDLKMSCPGIELNVAFTATCRGKKVRAATAKLLMEKIERASKQGGKKGNAKG